MNYECELVRFILWKWTLGFLLLSVHNTVILHTGYTKYTNKHVYLVGYFALKAMHHLFVCDRLFHNMLQPKEVWLAVLFQKRWSENQ